MVQGVGYELAGKHETAEGAAQRVPMSEAKRIVEKWPDPQKNVAHQMLQKYGPPNEAPKRWPRAGGGPPTGAEYPPAA